jgi:hypothetical protein
MGNYLTSLLDRKCEKYDDDDSSDSEEEFDYGILDEYTVDQLIEFIKEMDVKTLQIDDTLQDSMKKANIDIENNSLIAMKIELYEKLSQVLPKYVPKKQTKLKKTYFVKPRFGVDKVNCDTHGSGDKKDNESKPEFMDLKFVVVAKPTSPYKTGNISVIEYNNAFNDATMNKDMIGINKKMLEKLPNYMVQRLVNSFNQAYTLKSPVKNISFGKGFYIYKDAKAGPKDDVESFRKIIAIPNAVNHFHRVLALRLTDYLMVNKYIDSTIQKGGIPGQKFGILQQIYKLKCVLKHAVNHSANHSDYSSGGDKLGDDVLNNGCAVLFLDVSNAFGNVNRDNLYKVMERYGIDKDLINYHREYYKNLQYYIQTKDWTSDTMKWENGLMQGCPLSPTLFVLVLNYILVHLNEKYRDTMGYQIGDSLRLLFLAYIDDVAVVCKDKKSLETVFKELKEIFASFGLPLNQDKCAIMYVNEKDTLSDSKDESCLKNIPVVKTYKYLGEYISSDGSVTASYAHFIKDLGRRLYGLDKKKITNEEKLSFFGKFLRPWITKKLMLMYDLNKTQKLKIIVLVKQYLNKWTSAENKLDDESLKFFGNLQEAVSKMDDDVIKKMDKPKDRDVDKELQKDIDLSNYILKDNKSIDFKYEDINDDFDLDKFLANKSD